jgi:hypothetical protein
MSLMSELDVRLQQLIESDALGVRLEVTRGLPTWEFHPVLEHQIQVDRIRASITPDGDQQGGCGCLHFADIYVSFSDGSLKRPDIAIFCRVPSERDKPVSLVPEAVVEVISRGFETKDIELNPSFYLSQGVKDVVVFNPYTGQVLHFRRDATHRHASPVTVHLECGCRCIA